MAEQQTIKYDPQWTNMTMDNMIFQTNNVVVNFNYLPNVPAYKSIMKFLRNCPLYNAFTNCPSVIYQNFLREFWSTVVAFDPFPSTDEPKKCPLKEFLIKFLVLNWRTTPPPLNKSTPSQHLLAYISSLRLKDPSKVTDIELTAYMIAVNNQRDSVSLPPLVAKPKKGKSQTVASTLPKSQGPEASRALSKKRKKPKSKRPPTETKESPPKPTEGSEQSHSVSSGTGPCKSKPLPEGTATHPQDSGGNKQPLDRDTTSTTPNEGTAKTTSRPKGSLGDKDSGGNIPPADMEPIHTPVADPSWTGAKYQPDTEPLKLQTYADIQAFLLSDDELDKESDEEEVLAVGDDMDEDPQDDKEVRTPSPKQDQPEPSHAIDQVSQKDVQGPFNRITEKQWEQHEEAAVSYVDLKASIDQYYDENIAHRDQTDKLMEASMSSLDRTNTTISDLYKGLDVITQLLKDINIAIKDDLATNQKINEATKTFAKIYFNITEVLFLVKGFDFFAFLSAVKSLRDHAFKQEEASTAWMKSSTNMAWNLSSRMFGVELSQTALKQEISSLRKDTSEIKSMMTEMYTAFRGQSSSAPSGSVTPTLALTDIQINIDKGKGIATESDDDPSKKLVKASSIVRLNPDEPVRDKEEQIKKAEEEARLLAMTKPEVIKVVQEEAEKIGLDPKAIKGAKAGEMFKKAQDAKHVVLKRQHTKKVRKSLKLRMHK
ncbi:hypothetical protein Tco_0617599 [Tanacetum coccineum]